MIGLAVMAGWIVVGLVVASIEKSATRGSDIDSSMVTVLCVTGALAGGFVGQTFRLYVFGQALGFVFAVVGAKSLLQFYRSRTPAVRAREDLPAHPTPVAPAPPPLRPETSAGARFVEAIGWGALCAFVVAIAGVMGHHVGAKLYPQRYEQIPSDFFFVPFGMLLGFVAGVTGRLARPRWSSVQMIGVLIAAGIAYSGFLFEYARGRAIGAGVDMTFDPDPGVARKCDSAPCPQANPPLEWMVQGTMHVRVTGIAATVDSIEMYSSDMTAYAQGGQRVTPEERAARGRFEGPRVELEGRQLRGSRHIRPNDVASYPLLYAYRTRSGDSRREIVIYVHFTDAAGHRSLSVGGWKVR